MSKVSFSQTGIKWLWITLLVFIVDQVTKYLAHNYIQPFETIEVMPFFNLVIRYNPGAAFSFLADAGGWQKYLLSGLAILVSIGIVVWMYKTPANNRQLSVGLAFVLAGAVGNLTDRLILGKVIDFIDWYYPASSSSCFWGFFYGSDNMCHWPSFNIADASILLGAVMLLLDSYFTSKNEKSSEDNNEERAKKKQA